MLTLSTIIAAFSYCHASTPSTECKKACIGTDLTSSLCFEAIRIMAAYSFHKHWTASFDVKIDLNILYDTEDIIWNEHQNSLSDMSTIGSSQNEFKRDILETDLYLCFWPKKAFDGIQIIFGGRIRDRSNPDIIIGTGYSFEIMKNLYGSLAVHIAIKEAYRTRQFPFEGIRTGINYIF